MSLNRIRFVIYSAPVRPCVLFSELICGFNAAIAQPTIGNTKTVVSDNTQRSALKTCAEQQTERRTCDLAAYQ